MDPTPQPAAARPPAPQLREGGWTVRFSKRRILRVLGVVVIFILVLHLGVHIYHYQIHPVDSLLRDAVNVDEEQNFPTWYQAFTLLFAGVLAGGIGAWVRRRGEPLGRYWWGISVALVYMSMDEVAGFHEIVNSSMDTSWTVPFAIVAGLFALSYIPFVRRVHRLTAKRLMIAAVVYCLGAIAVEKFTEWFIQISSLDVDLAFYTLKIRHTEETIANTLDYHVLTTLEEGLEMLGVLLMIRTFLYHLGPGDDVVFTAATNAAERESAA